MYEEGLRSGAVRGVDWWVQYGDLLFSAARPDQARELMKRAVKALPPASRSPSPLGMGGRKGGRWVQTWR